MKNLLLVFVGIIIGGIGVYFLNPTIINPNWQNIKVLKPRPVEKARRMIDNLYTFLSDSNNDPKSLFRRSFAISANDIKGLLTKHPEAELIRIYPALDIDSKNKKTLTFILMTADSQGTLIWDKDPSQANVDQDEIQDYFEPCPPDCGKTSNEIIEETKWTQYAQKIPSLAK
jgi:hypothetical protein